MLTTRQLFIIRQLVKLVELPLFELVELVEHLPLSPQEHVELPLGLSYLQHIDTLSLLHFIPQHNNRSVNTSAIHPLRSGMVEARRGRCALASRALLSHLLPRCLAMCLFRGCGRDWRA